MKISELEMMLKEMKLNFGDLEIKLFDSGWEMSSVGFDPDEYTFSIYHVDKESFFTITI